MHWNKGSCWEAESFTHLGRGSSRISCNGLCRTSTRRLGHLGCALIGMQDSSSCYANRYIHKNCSRALEAKMAAGCERLLAILNDQILTPDGTTQKTDHRLQQARKLFQTGKEFLSVMSLYTSAQARAQMHKAKAQFMKQRLLQQLLQALSVSYNGLNLRLGLAEAVHCLGLPMHGAGIEGSLFGLGESHLNQLGANTPEVRHEGGEGGRSEGSEGLVSSGRGRKNK